MLKPNSLERTAGCVALRAFRTGVAMSSIICWAVLLARAAAAQSDPQVAEFLTSINRGITELAGQAGSKANLTCARIVASAIDMGAITESALGHVWDRMTPHQRAAYRVAAQRWAVGDCVRRNQDIGGNPLEFLGVRQGVAGERLLATRSNQPAHTVIWRLRGSGRVRAVDVVIDGRSMILSLRDETRALLDQNNGDIDMAIGVLGR
jgi:ABC-type transporter MlaC component